jgi:hypothetical protein
MIPPSPDFAETDDIDLSFLDTGSGETGGVELCGEASPAASVIEGRRIGSTPSIEEPTTNHQRRRQAVVDDAVAMQRPGAVTEPTEDVPEALESFFGQDKNLPQVVYKKENARHRRILFLKAHGLSNIEIANIVGMTPVGVGLVVRQPWFQEGLAALMNNTGCDGVKKAIQSAALDSVFKIIELRDSASSEAVQRDCAFDLLDRYLGKAVQPIGESNKATIADESKLDAEIAELTKKIAAN